MNRKTFIYSIKIITISILGIGLFGCGKATKISAPQKYRDASKFVGNSIKIIPELNAISTQYTGEAIYQKLNAYNYNTYDVKLINNNCSEIKEMDPVLYKWTSKNLNTICRYDKKGCLVDANQTNTFTHKVDDLNDFSDFELLDCAIKYQIIPTPPRYDELSFTYEVLYQGRIDNKIKISFREFKDDMARPAFTQDIEYQLDKDGGTVVGFKGLRIKVIKATNTDITYSVIQDYN